MIIYSSQWTSFAELFLCLNKPHKGLTLCVLVLHLKGVYIELKLTKFVEKRQKWAEFWEILRTFAKNTAHNERCLLNFSYICTVAENPSQLQYRKRLAFSMLRTSTTLKSNWKGKDVLPSVMIVVGFWPKYVIQGCELFFLIYYSGSRRPLSKISWQAHTSFWALKSTT